MCCEIRNLLTTLTARVNNSTTRIEQTNELAEIIFDHAKNHKPYHARHKQQSGIRIVIITLVE